jgi:formamidopyrimidine-DNA glycosylase
MAAKKKINKLVNGIKDPNVRNELIKLFLKREEIMKEEKIKKETELKQQTVINNKYLPKYLSIKILNAVGFVEYTRSKGHLDMKGMVKFLETDKKFSQKEIGWVLLLLSIESIEEILGIPEIGGKIQEVILKSRKTLH